MNLATTDNRAHEAGTLPSATDRRRRGVLVFSSTFPSAVQPIHGVFVKERVRHVAAANGCEVQVVSPVPYFPPLKRFHRWYPLSQIAREEVVDGLRVTRPRYVLLPKVGKHFHTRSMARAACPTVSRIDQDFDCDVVDAHFVYPDGIAAMHVAKRIGKPLVITGRGEDVLTCPSDPVLRPGIVEALRSADQLIAVSEEIAEAMVQLGANEKCVTVIPNGVDVERFSPMDRGDARRMLQLPTERPIVLSVGYRLERKGFHLLIEAASRLRQEHPELLVAIVGGPARWGQDYTAEIEAAIQRLDMEQHVLMVGPQSQEELKSWYSAADLFGLLSSREGCPNALMEALACGLPAFATRVGQIPSVLADERLGTLVASRTAEAAAEALNEGLKRTWDRNWIRSELEACSWTNAAQRIHQVFDRAIEQHNEKRV